MCGEGLGDWREKRIYIYIKDSSSETVGPVLPLGLLVRRLNRLEEQPPGRREPRQREQPQDGRVKRRRRREHSENCVLVDELEHGADGGDGHERRRDEVDRERRAGLHPGLGGGPRGLFLSLAADPGELVGVLRLRGDLRLCFLFFCLLLLGLRLSFLFFA